MAEAVTRRGLLAGAALPVAGMGREAVRLDRVHGALEERAFASPEPARGRLLAEAERVMDRLYDVEDAASARRAARLAGAMVQVGLAMGDADTLESHVPGGAGELIGRIRANLYSVLAVLERAGGVPRAAVVGDRYMPARLDP